ncbi:hypothetical protein ACU61A_41030 [Pseudonocardia sichuanensis]
MTAAVSASPDALGVTLTDLARHAAGRASGRPYRDASTGAWCSPSLPHVPGCTCQRGEIGCAAHWAAPVRVTVAAPTAAPVGTVRPG